LRVGEIGKYLLRGLRDNILNFRHGVPRFQPAHISAAVSPGLGCGIFLRRMMRKSHSHDKADVRGAACKGGMKPLSCQD
jgi:hypothetical protein